MNPVSIAIGKAAALIAIAIAAGGLVGGCFLSNRSPVVVQIEDRGVTVKKLWADADPPGFDDRHHDPADATRSSQLVAGRPVIRLSNVSYPELHIYQRDAGTMGDTGIVVCPGGGFSILAWDLEGVEVARWLNSIGITVAVLKYRVPTHRLEKSWEAPVQDAQRAISTLRSMAASLGVNQDQIGVLGFSAGAIAAARTGLMRDRQYAAVDEIDEYSCGPNFMALIYVGGLIDKTGQRLKSGLVADGETPPVFMVHAFDDYVLLDTPVVMLRAMKAAGVPAELHVYDSGGHGYGVRRLDQSPVTTWPDLFQDWMQRNGWLKTPPQGEVQIPESRSVKFSRQTPAPRGDVPAVPAPGALVTSTSTPPVAAAAQSAPQ